MARYSSNLILPPRRHQTAAYMRSRANATAPSRHSTGIIDRGQLATFTDLPAELRNRIYDYVAPPRTQHVTICAAERDYRDVPHALSRTCRLARREMAPYFLSGDDATVIFVLINAEDERVAREWCSFVPEACLGEVRRLKVKVLHSRPAGRDDRDQLPEWRSGVDGNNTCQFGCEIVHVFFMDEQETPLKWYGHLGTPKHGCLEKAVVLRRLEVLKELFWRLPIEVEGSRVGGRKVTRDFLGALFDCLVGDVGG